MSLRETRAQRLLGWRALVASAGEAWSNHFGFSRDGIGWDGGDFEGKAGEGRGRQGSKERRQIVCWR
jgi:hypothetical protein